MERLTLQKLLEVKERLGEIEESRPKYYDDKGCEYILFNLEKE